MPKDYVEPLFMGLKIKCSTKYPTVKSILDSLYVMTFTTAKKFFRPLGFHCRFRLKQGVQLKLVSGRFVEKFSKKYGYKPFRVTCIENDSSGSHYHMAVIIDGKKNTKYALRNFFAEMTAKGFVADYDVIPPKAKPHGYQLDDEDEAEKFFEWMSYIAKTDTKPCDRQKHSTDLETFSDLCAWRRSGKPMLINPQKSNEEPQKKSFSDLSVFMQDHTSNVTAI